MCDKVKKIPPVQIAYLAPISLSVLAPVFPEADATERALPSFQPPAHRLSAPSLTSPLCSLSWAGTWSSQGPCLFCKCVAGVEGEYWGWA